MIVLLETTREYGFQPNVVKIITDKKTETVSIVTNSSNNEIIKFIKQIVYERHIKTGKHMEKEYLETLMNPY